MTSLLILWRATPNCIRIMVMFCVHCLAVPTKSNTPASRRPLRKPLSQCDSPVFVSDSDDDDDNNIVVKSTWRTRHSKSPPKANMNNARVFDKEESSSALPFSSPFSLPAPKTLTSLATPTRSLSVPSKVDDSASSEEEFTSLLERLKKKNKITGTSFSPRNTHGNSFIWMANFVFILVARLISIVLFVFVLECSKEPPVSAPPVKGFTKPTSKSLGEPPLHVKTPGKSTILKPTVSQSEPRHNPTSRYWTSVDQFVQTWIFWSLNDQWAFISVFVARSLCLSYTHVFISPCSHPSRVALCKTPGCFLQSLSNPGTSYGLNFKQKKVELTSKLYQLYNTSVFDSKVINNILFLSTHWKFLEMSSTMQILCSVYFNFFISFWWLVAARQYVSDLE